ncbi:dynamin family protein [Lentimicrobium sp. S6]|uniref:dynamin family protein n=1 Tax=Lentimicrobium sp. S6 TaxID=2735872 RepID=UPI001557D818|nr:dynamin family protein [Lentimicrobium sp. S6]NPD46905.1 hypothetical protein [Lentimicrobium sp. S6]
MISEPVKKIFEEFDEVYINLGNNLDTKEHIDEVLGDIKLIKLWEKELESDKQSIFIIGKTSTGKSEFHNFLLDIDNKKDALFKASTKVETSIIQTLEHCDNKSDSYAEIIVKNANEFKKLIIPIEIKYEFNNNDFKIPLDNTEQIGFFRDKIIAKSDIAKSFDVIKAISQVNIKYPLKFLKAHKIIDTPGLASSEPVTDTVVRDYFNGKSHIFWFIDASDHTLSDSLTLLKEEEKLLKASSKRIFFIANKFDLIDIDDYNESKKEVLSKIMEKMTKDVKEMLDKILSSNSINTNILFTSFKKPNKTFVTYNTIDTIKQLEENILLDKKKSNYRNIFSLISTMKKVLLNIKDKVLQREGTKINDKIEDLKKSFIGIHAKKSILNKQYEQTLDIIKESICQIENIKKEKKLNTHKLYNNYIKLLEEKVDTSTTKIYNSVRRMEYVNLQSFFKKLDHVGRIKDLSLREKENLLKYFIYDGELNEKKKGLLTYIHNKSSEFNDLKNSLRKIVEECCNDELNNMSKEISKLNHKKENIANNSKIILSIKSKVDNIDHLLLEDIEKRVALWDPRKNKKNDSFVSFLKLYSLIDDHKLIKNKTVSNE